jgi:hypothetical protein
VILDDYGNPLPYSIGLTLALGRLGWTREDFGRLCGYRDPATIRQLCTVRKPSAPHLNLLGLALKKAGQSLDHDSLTAP